MLCGSNVIAKLSKFCYFDRMISFTNYTDIAKISSVILAVLMAAKTNEVQNFQCLVIII